MSTLLATTLSVIIGSVLVIGGVTVNTDDILAEANTVVNQANVHQIATVLELYHLDNNEYPNVTGGTELISLL